MNPPDQRIIDFIGEHHILNLAVVKDNIPWCATCYYAWLKEENRFVVTSDPGTRHISDMVADRNFHVAGTIALETRITGKIRGIQFSGFMAELEGGELAAARKAYLKRFPIARLMPGLHLWSLTPDFIKMTDNRLGFGKKLLWNRQDQSKSAPDQR